MNKTTFLLAFMSLISWGQQNENLQQKTNRFNVFINTQSSFNSEKNEENSTPIQSFRVNQLRLEFRGDLSEKLFYRFRHRINQNSQAASLDNISNATDLMSVGYHIDEKWTILGGKISQDWGGFEFDPNPIYIYEYSEFINHIDNYLTGVSATYTPNKNHEFILNITNARTENFQDLYQNATDIQKSSSPLAYLLNWNGNFFNQKLQTRWAVGYHQEAKNYGNTTLMLGTKLNLQKFQFFVDYYASFEELDRLKYENIAINTNEPLKNISYHSIISKVSFQPSKKWNIFAQGMYETYNIKTLPQGSINPKKRIFGYQTGVEYIPFNDQNLRLFAVFLGKNYQYKTLLPDENQQHFSLGLIYLMKIF